MGEMKKLIKKVIFPTAHAWIWEQVDRIDSEMDLFF